MSWQNTLTLMVRALIDDLDPSNYKYTDSRIQQGIVIAGLLVSQDYQFSTTYTFDIEDITINPDPVDANDQIFMALVVLKDACILNQAKISSSILGAVKIQEGDSGITTGLSGPASIALFENGPCGAYNTLLQILLRRKIRGQAVSSPYSSFSSAGGPFGGFDGIWSIRGFYNSFLSF